MENLIKEPSSRFLKLRCQKCKNEQIVFGKATSEISCLVCNQVIASPSGGKAKIKARILEILE